MKVHHTTTSSYSHPTKETHIFPQLLSRQKPSQSNYLFNCTSLLGYTDDIRNIFLNAKIKNDPNSINILITAITNNQEALRFLSKYTLIYIMPSSMWGRLKGQFDFAYYMTHFIKKEHYSHWDIAPTPFKLYWRIRKRAKIKKIKNSYSWKIFLRNAQNSH